jgi:hypothetical protein
MKKSEHQIEKILERLSSSKPPSAPANVEQNVWRKIRLATSEVVDWRPAFWPQWLTNPAFAFGLVAFSAALGVLVSSGHARSTATAESVADVGFSLSVFSDHAPGMLHSGLSTIE